VYVANGCHNHGELGIFFKMTHFYKDDMQVYIICKDKISHIQLTVPITEKKHE